MPCSTFSVLECESNISLRQLIPGLGVNARYWRAAHLPQTVPVVDRLENPRLISLVRLAQPCSIDAQLTRIPIQPAAAVCWP
ncbi:hypothetical protein A7J71_17760 [Achromobacter insolitus]|nr:hypothetical protein A7J71_17760 [Achromobacter insolitus]